MEKIKTLINAPEVCVCIIDEQPQMFFGVQSTDRQTIMNNVVGLAKAAKVFNIPIVLSTVESESFSGYIYSKLQDVYPIYAPIERTTLNSWEDKNFKQAVEKTGKKKLVIAGLWTEVCVTLPTISAIAEGYDVIIVTDASGGATKEAHDMAILRMVQAGAVPVTWQALMLEWQRDWARKDTYNAVTAVIKEHGGAYGMGIEYATTMLPPSATSS